MVNPEKPNQSREENLNFKAMYNSNKWILSIRSKTIYYIILISIITGCTKSEIALPLKEVSEDATQLMSSSTILRNQVYLNTYGIINYNESISKKLVISSGDTAILVVTPISKNGIIVAAIESIKLPKNKLPHNDDYAINLVDLRKYNLKTQSGQIEMIDLNYDLYIHSIILVDANHIKSWDSKGLSLELEAKYNSPEFKLTSRQINSTNQTLKENGGIYSLCDRNGDQNISYSECYKCVSDAIAADGFSTFICDIPILGWASCFVSKSATCIVLSSAY